MFLGEVYFPRNPQPCRSSWFPLQSFCSLIAQLVRGTSEANNLAGATRSREPRGLGCDPSPSAALPPGSVKPKGLPKLCRTLPLRRLSPAARTSGDQIHPRGYPGAREGAVRQELRLQGRRQRFNDHHQGLRALRKHPASAFHERNASAGTGSDSESPRPPAPQAEARGASLLKESQGRSQEGCGCRTDCCRATAVPVPKASTLSCRPIKRHSPGSQAAERATPSY